MAAPAGLHAADLHRAGEIGNVEDPEAPEAVFIDLARRALQPAIDAAAGLFDTHDKQVADHRNVALPSGADDRAHQIGHAIRAELVDVEAVVGTGDHHIAEERHVGVGEIEQRRAFGEFGEVFLLARGRRAIGSGRICGGHVRLGLVLVGHHLGLGVHRLLVALGLLVLLGCGGRAQVGGVGGVEEPGRLGQRRHLGEVHDRLTGVVEPGSKARARIGRQPGEQLVHPLDLGLLFGVDIAGKAIEHRIGGTAIGVEQVIDHVDRALVVGDHQSEELLVELGARCCGERRHLIGARHAHHHVMRMAFHHRIFDRLAALRQPALHEGDFIGLARFDPASDFEQIFGVGAILGQQRHVHRLLVMDDHALHEGDIFGGVGGGGQFGRFLRRQGLARLPRRAGLHDRHGLRHCHARGRQQQGREGGARGPQRSDFGHVVPLSESLACRLPPLARQSTPPCVAALAVRRTSFCIRAKTLRHSARFRSRQAHLSSHGAK